VPIKENNLYKNPKNSKTESVVKLKKTMKKIAFLILFLTQLFGFSQDIKVIDSTTKLPIQYATIKVLKEGVPKIGIYTDENGSFNLTAANYNEHLIVSCVGYETKTVTLTKNETSIELEKEINNLKEVIILNNKKPIQIGYIDEKKCKDKVGVSAGLEVAVFIANNFDYEVQINTVQFKIKKSKERAAYRLHLYTLTENGLSPNEDLILENSIYYIEPKTEGLIEINVSNLNLTLPKNGVFVGIEGIGGEITSTPMSNYNNLKFEAHKSTLPIYQERYLLNKVGWVNINKWLPQNYYDSFKLIYDPERLYVPSFGLKVSRIIN
jgi:hypothetical protein